MYDALSCKSVIDSLILQWVRRHHSEAYAELLNVIDQSNGQITFSDIQSMVDGMMHEDLLPEMGSANPSNCDH